MITKENVIGEIKSSGIVAVVRAETTDRAKQIVEDCIDGGIKVIELTFTVPFAHSVIEELAKSYGKSALIGAGTVLDSETARIAVLSGASFVVSPHFNPEITRLCNRYRIANMSGILTVKEAVEAMESGVDILKLFPANLVGPAFIKDINGPLPQAQIMPTGGVTVENTSEWIKAGAVAVGVGGSLTKGNVRQNAAAFCEQIKISRNEMNK